MLRSKLPARFAVATRSMPARGVGVGGAGGGASAYVVLHTLQAAERLGRPEAPDTCCHRTRQALWTHRCEPLQEHGAMSRLGPASKQKRHVAPASRSSWLASTSAGATRVQAPSATSDGAP